MREVIVLTFESSANSWADEYGLAASEAPAAFADMVKRNAAELAAAVGDAWPAMRGMVSAAYVSDDGDDE